MQSWLKDFSSDCSFSKVALERLLLTWVPGWHYFYLPSLEPDVETRVHPARNISESNPLVDSILEERNGPVASIVQDANTGRCLFALAAVAEDGPRLEPVLVDTDKF